MEFNGEKRRKDKKLKIEEKNLTVNDNEKYNIEETVLKIEKKLVSKWMCRLSAQRNVAVMDFDG